MKVSCTICCGTGYYYTCPGNTPLMPSQLPIKGILTFCECAIHSQRLFTTTEVAKMLGYSRSYIYRLACKKQVRTIGNQFIFDMHNIRSFDEELR